MTDRQEVLTRARVPLVSALAVALVPILFGWRLLGQGSSLEVMLTASVMSLIPLMIVSLVRDVQAQGEVGVRLELHVALLSLVALPLAALMRSILGGAEDPGSAQFAFMVLATAYFLYAVFATATSVLWGTRRWRVILFHLGGFTMPILSAVVFLLTSEWEFGP